MKRNYLKLVSLLLVIIMSAVMITACSKNDQNADNKGKEDTNQDVSKDNEEKNNENNNNEENFDGKLVLDRSMELKYAKEFSVDYYKGGYKMIKTSDGNEVLIVPEGMSTPADVSDNVIVLQAPVQNMLVSSTPTMSLINSINMLDRVKTTTNDRDDWYITEIAERMDKNEIIYVGSYKAPDYEIITTHNPPFAVFTGMLNTVPEVAEKMNELKIPYILDMASEEMHPLARVEWVKLYGALFDCEDKAEEVFEKQLSYVTNLDTAKVEDKSVVMFYITSKGALHVRQGGDYMAKMLELAGGKYIFADLNPEESGTEKMEFEEFYSKAKDADYIIYIWSLGGRPSTLEDFLSKNELFKDFKAVQEGNVWCTTPDYFQISDTLGHMIKDMNDMLTLEDPSVDSFSHLVRLK